MTIDELSAELGKRLSALKAQVVTAESCTGGGIAEAITRVACSSAWFEAGFVTYSKNPFLAAKMGLVLRAWTLSMTLSAHTAPQGWGR